MDGSCTACVGARRIYCLDGGREDEEGNTIGDRYDAEGNYIDDSALLNDYSLGSCQPKWSYCTWIKYKFRAALMNYRECEYTPVQQPGLEEYYQDDMIDLVITDEMALKIKNGENLSLLEFLFQPNQLQFVRVTNAQTTIDAGLYFTGIFDIHKHVAIENDPRIVNQIDLNRLKVYFSDREPVKNWGYPSQLDDLYEDIVTPLDLFDTDVVYVTISNPSTYYYQMQMRLEEAPIENAKDQAINNLLIQSVLSASLILSISLF